MPRRLESNHENPCWRASHRGRFLFPVLSIFLSIFTATPSRADELLSDGLEPPPVELSTIIAAGASVAIGSDLGTQPQLGCFRDLPGAWQVGLQVRFALAEAERGYDYRPITDISFRKLWLSDEDTHPIRNSEYVGLSVGGYFAYDFGGNQIGLKPFGTVDLGKYWMPFDNSPLGLDLNLELTRYLTGHLPNRSETAYVTLGLHVFYLIP
ncbi:MAG: hypothetical protein ABI036_16480 [Fibrobacteria bacterium]